MICLMLMADNEREQQILRMALEQRGLKVIVSKPRFQNYVMALQYVPDVFLMEFPRLCTDQSNFVRLLRKHKKTASTPIIAYGDETDQALKRGIVQQGATIYVSRPIKFASLLTTIDGLLRPFRKKIEAAPPKSDKDKDVELILNSNAMPRQKIEAMCRHVEKLLAFPFTVAKVLRITQDPKSGAAQLAKAIQADPVISANMLKVSNSVFFATAGRRIDSIKDAIVRIGFLETKKIAMTMSVMKIFDEKKKSLGFDRVDFWYHSLAAGIISEQIAKHMADVSGEAAFLAGLLHDLGIIIFDDYFPGIFDQLLEDTTKSGSEFIDSGTRLLGVNHNDMMAELFEAWKIPQEISEGIITHYKIETFKENLGTPGRKLALCVAIGNTVAKTLRLGRECDEYVRPLDNWVFEAARMIAGITPNFIDTVYQGVEAYRLFLGLDQREYPRECTGVVDAGEARVGLINPGGRTFVPPAHYLAKQGEVVETISTKNAPSSYDGKYSLILVWADEQTTVESLIDFCHVVRYQKEQVQGAEKVSMAPMLVVSPPGWSMPDDERTKNLSVIPHECDLRQFDGAIGEMLMGKVVRMPWPDKPRGKAETPPQSAHVDEAATPALASKGPAAPAPPKHEAKTSGSGKALGAPKTAGPAKTPAQ
jgi:HD-like signal output (HDOD) protein